MTQCTGILNSVLRDLKNVDPTVRNTPSTTLSKYYTAFKTQSQRDNGSEANSLHVRFDSQCNLIRWNLIIISLLDCIIPTAWGAVC